MGSACMGTSSTLTLPSSCSRAAVHSSTAHLGRCRGDAGEMQGRCRGDLGAAVRSSSAHQYESKRLRVRAMTMVAVSAMWSGMFSTWLGVRLGLGVLVGVGVGVG